MFRPALASPQSRTHQLKTYNLSVLTVGKGLAPSGGEILQIYTIFRRIRRMLRIRIGFCQFISTCCRKEQSPFPTVKPVNCAYSIGTYVIVGWLFGALNVQGILTPVCALAQNDTSIRALSLPSEFQPWITNGSRHVIDTGGTPARNGSPANHSPFIIHPSLKNYVFAIDNHVTMCYYHFIRKRRCQK